MRALLSTMTLLLLATDGSPRVAALAADRTDVIVTTATEGSAIIASNPTPRSVGATRRTSVKSRRAPRTQSYPLTCVFDGAQTIGIRPSSTEPKATLLVSVAFRPAAKASTMGVEPGTCAWQDRAFRAGEPAMLVHRVPHVWTYRHAPSAGQQVPILTPQMAPWAPQAATAGYQITFKVYQSAPSEGIAYPYLRVE